MSSTTKPKLPALTTPVTASFPAEALASAVSLKTPLSSVLRDPLASAGLPSAGLPSAGMASPFSAVAMVKTEDALAKTPITPPVAYLDFLKLASPVLASPPPTAGCAKSKLSRTSTSESNDSTKSASSDGTAEDRADGELADSAPSTATSDASECSCDCDHIHKSPTAKAANAPASPPANHPLSAPATGATTFASMRIPPSPAAGNVDSPIQSPFSARSVRSPFDWEAALKARRYNEANKVTSNGHLQGCSKAAPSPRTSVRHIREVVTRTVTYTPRMDPAPKGKRRKVQ